MIDELCPELISLIYGFLSSRSDIRNMRLVSRVCGEVGSRSLFKVLHVNPTFASLTDFGLRKVSQVRRFAHVVEEVIIHIKHPQDIIDGICQQNLVPKHGNPTVDYHAIWKPFQTETEIRWFRSIHERNCAMALTECFSALPRLMAIEIYQEPVKPGGFIEGDYRPKAEATYKLCAIMIAASTLKNKLVSLSTNTSLIFNHQRWLPYSQKVLRASVRDVLENIRTLHIRPVRGGVDFNTDILNMAKNLVQLRIRFTHIINHRPRDDCFHISSLISAWNFWPHLKELTLENFALGDHKPLLHLLERHKSTLRVFTMRNFEHNCLCVSEFKMSRSLKMWENLIRKVKGILSNCQINITTHP